MFWEMKIAFRNTRDSHAKRLSGLLFHRISLRLGWESKCFLNAIFGLWNIDFHHGKLNVLENENRVQKHHGLPRQTLDRFTFYRISLRLGWESKRFLNAISNIWNIDFHHGKT